MSRITTLVAISLTICSLDAGSEAELRVFVYDRGSTPPLLLQDAVIRAARVLATAGVKSSWKVCPPASVLPGGPECADSPSLPILLRLVSSAEAQRWPMEPQTCGMAITGALREYGVQAIVDNGCIERKGGPSHETRAGLMAHVFAHEIGHLLLGRDSHNSSGLMSARWTRAEMGLMLRTQLKFTSTEIVRLQQAVTARALQRSQPDNH